MIETKREVFIFTSSWHAWYGRLNPVPPYRETNFLQPAALRHHLSMDLVLLQIGDHLVRLPSGRSPREAKVRHFEVGPLHNFLKKK